MASDDKDEVRTNEPLTGSSKRKRKSTIIKRNVTTDESQEESTSLIGTIKLISPQKLKAECRKSKRIKNNKVRLEKEENSNEDEDVDCPEEGVKDTAEICVCKLCQMCCNSRQSLVDHQQKCHSAEPEESRVFECKHCSEPTKFKTKQKYAYHVSTKHPGVMEFICEVCTSTFKLKANYKAHMSTHDLKIKKKFTCQVCAGTFVNKAGFESHKRRFPGSHFKKSCEHCGFSFSRESHMKNHRCKILLLEEAEKARNLQLLSEKNRFVEIRVSTPVDVQVSTPITISVPTTTGETITDEILLETEEHQQQTNQQQQQPIYFTQSDDSVAVLEEYTDNETQESTNDEQTIIMGSTNNKNTQVFQDVTFNDLEGLEDSPLQLLQWRGVPGVFVIKEKNM